MWYALLWKPPKKEEEKQKNATASNERRIDIANMNERSTNHFFGWSNSIKFEYDNLVVAVKKNAHNTQQPSLKRHFFRS